MRRLVIAKLRNEIFTSLGSLNSAIRKAVKEYNDRPFQKRDGSRILAPGALFSIRRKRLI